MSFVEPTLKQYSEFEKRPREYFKEEREKELDRLMDKQMKKKEVGKVKSWEEFEARKICHRIQN